MIKISSAFFLSKSVSSYSGNNYAALPCIAPAPVPDTATGWYSKACKKQAKRLFTSLNLLSMGMIVFTPIILSNLNLSILHLRTLRLTSFYLSSSSGSSNSSSTTNASCSFSISSTCSTRLLILANISLTSSWAVISLKQGAKSLSTSCLS